MHVLAVPQGEFDLTRFPVRKNDLLRPWDAADELVLAHVAGLGLDEAASILAVNSGAGALPVALASVGTTSVTVLSDSYLDHVATLENLRRNHLDPSSVTLLDPFSVESTGGFDLVIVKVPKSLALLEDELHRIRPHLQAGSVVVGAGMSKHIHSSTLQLFERIVGTTTTSLAQKKARLILCSPDPSLDPGPNPWPATLTVAGAHGPTTVINHANVFSRERLDVGTRFFLEHLPSRDDACRVVDLGCGNGVVGLEAARRCPAAEITFVDESFMAVASAKATFDANLDERSARFVVGDTLFHLAQGEPIARGSVDLVLNNPPFHDDHALSDAVAWQMFTEAHGALAPGGELWVVGNRHLAYHAKLKRIFGNCKVVASNSKFVVYRSQRADVRPEALSAGPGW